MIRMIRKRYSHGPYVMLHLVNGRRVLEHRYVMEQYLGRVLRTEEIVHHLDGNGKNNALFNLELLHNTVHSILHAESRPPEAYVLCICEHCGDKYPVRARKYRFKVKRGEHFFCSRPCIGRFAFTAAWRNR